MKKFIAVLAFFAIAGCFHGDKGKEVTESGVTYKVTESDGIYAVNASLTGTPGDAANGRKVAINRSKGNCLACHTMPAPDQQFHGETGPSLWGIGARLGEGELRVQMIDSKIVYPDTMMPSFFRSTGYNRSKEQFIGKTILTPQEVEDVVAYLQTLTTDQP